MKRSGTTIIFVIICAAVLVAAYGIGLCIREIRFQGVKTESKAGVESEKSDTKPEMERIEAERMSTSSAERPGFDLTTEEIEQSEDMPEEEPEESRARMHGFDDRQPSGGDRFQNLSEEERARIAERRRQMRERWESMSEEERQDYREKRGRFGTRRSSSAEQGDRSEFSNQPDSEQQESDSEQRENE